VIIYSANKRWAKT